MKRVILFAVLSVVSTILWGQNDIRGTVVDGLTQEPLPSATVYINGTTHGTSTDVDGRFELKDVSLPTTVIFSFVGYEPQALDLVRNPGELTIMLKVIELPEIEVSGKPDKDYKKDLEYFKTMFLGDDRWGRRAKIKNENALVFDRSDEVSYEIRRIFRKSYSIRTIYCDVVEKFVDYNDSAKVNKTVFSAWATEPLIIDLPLLGYELYVDLVKFTVQEYRSQINCDMLGYFYFKPYDNVSKRKARSFEANRMKAYYGSSQHFLRSFAEDNLTENGYALTMKEKGLKGKKVIWTDIPVDINNILPVQETT